MKMIQNEFKFIAKNRLIMISLIAIVFIPFLYSIFFLKSVWDPYGSTGELPVAVVNNDQPATYNGETLSAGKDMVKELKKNDQLGWRFVSAKKAQQGLKDKEYYTVVTLPKNFSANAATVLDKNPKKMQIQYKTNDSLNFIGEVISEMGAKELNAQVRETVTNAYAKVMFKQVKTAGKGFSTAAKGAKQLTDGSVTLSDGLNVYTAGVAQVNDGIMTMKTSVVPLSDGVKQLADGSNTLNNGLLLLDSKTGALASGASQLNDGAGQLNAGANQLNTGLQTLNSKTGALASGAGQLNDGANKLNAGVTGYTNGASDLNAGLKKLADSNVKINEKISGLPAGVTALKAGSQQISDRLQGMQKKLKEYSTFENETAYNTAVAQYSSINGRISQVQATIPALQSELNAIPDQVATTTDFDAKAQGIIDAEKQAGIVFTAQQEAGIKAKLSEQLKASAKDEAQQIVSGINAKIDAQKPTADEYAKLTKAVNDSLSMLSSLKQIQTGLNYQDDANPGLVMGIQQLDAGIGELASGSQAIIAKLNQYTTGVATAAAGANKLTSMNGQLVSGSSQLAAGTNQLNGQIPALTGGVSQLANGSSALATGSSALAAGTGALNAQVPQLTSGISQLATGSTALNNGLGQLNGQIPTLTSGVDQLAAGTNQLTDNSAKLTDGAGQLTDGNKTLASALKSGANEVNSIQLTDKTADMFAAPAELKHSNYSYVPNYGHALAPYVLSVALFVGAIVFNFAYPIRKISMTGQSSTAWFLSKITVGALVAVGMAIIEPALMMVAGLNVDHPAQFFLMAITFSLASMSIIMFLSMTFDNPGRFLAMVLLMLQLGGSGGTFPMEITNHFYNVIHPFLPMTYSILGLREAITSGLGTGQIVQSFFVLLAFIVVALLLLWLGMNHLQKIGNGGRSQLDDNQKLQDVEK
ncbi:YhgE/Pip domain-containing protein [Latilactobacillus curvatus]|uniref:YhgE/Pip domain-containing protein n=1 Tax=Latilactobacillus curvatus TaxID=28038 RepID=UPI00223C02A6|nr:YhgE/Pip domain-containing protein [Latilactobacillus curvatus]MCS8581678.1 YhgE/Pip domain-containing protein [Latilactobacillus curvatus]MCS8605369.1 YhgE/Pip domain-containing protein [Latilactobacillus curvatus]